MQKMYTKSQFQNFGKFWQITQNSHCMPEILLKIQCFQRGLSKSLKKVNFTFSKLMEMGGGGGGGLKIFARKGGVRQNGEGLSRNGGGCHIILRFFWRFVMIQHRKRSLCVYLSFVNKNVLIGIAIVLIVLTVIIAVLIIHANNKHSV